MIINPFFTGDFITFSDLESLKVNVRSRFICYQTLDRFLQTSLLCLVCRMRQTNT